MTFLKVSRAGLIQTGSNYGAWDGPGLVTSRPDAQVGVATLGIATADEKQVAG